MNKNELISQIIDLEWPMFSTVENQGGKASCQSRPETFVIMRRSQYIGWPENVLASYLEDLQTAAKTRRNLCAEKYAFMMAYTVPAEFERIKNRLPVISEEKQQKIREIVDINILWEEDLDKTYPHLRSNGRPLRSTQDTPYSVSVETYLLCELKTYSEKTVNMLHDHTLKSRAQGINLAEITLENTVKSYGYESLKEAEERYS